MSSDTCDFCGLPVSAARKTVAERTPQPVYCCFGCEFAAEVTRSTGREGANRILLLRIGLAAFCTMNVLAFTMVLWTHDIYPSSDDVRAALLDDVLRYLGLLFSLPVWFVLGQPLLLSAVSHIRRGIPATDFLVCLGVLAAYGFSMVSTWRGAGPVYYEVACVVLVLITLGRWLEAQGKLQASSALDDLERLIPDVVRVCVDEHEATIPVSEVRVGDRLRISAGECICVDGLITSGCANIDERLLTGESWPVEKNVGDLVQAGAFNLDGHLEVTSTSTAADGSLGKLVRGLREARQHRGRYERIAERITAWFLPAVIVVALGALGWHGWFHGFETGVLIGLSVLLIACPCALGLATPLAAWTAFSHAARHHVLFRNGEALERLAGIKAVAWDKTGTLTSSQPSVDTIVWGPVDSETDFLAEVVELASKSNHPYSRALVHSFGGLKRDKFHIDSVREHPGRGMVGRCADGSLIFVGNQRLADELELQWPARLHAAWKQLHADGRPVLISGRAGWVHCLLSITETLRPGAAESVYQLQSRGIHQLMLTGDHSARAERIMRELFEAHADIPTPATDGVTHPGPAADFTFFASLLPNQKVQAVRHLRKKYGSVAMIGDGVNDAPALTAADVGISLRSGADISRDSAGVCLFGDDVQRLPWAIDYAKFTVRIIQQNLFWAFGYNTVGVTLAAAGYLNPSLAALLMVGSSGFVIANTWRLQLEATTGTGLDSEFANPALLPAVGAADPEARNIGTLGTNRPPTEMKSVEVDRNITVAN